MDFQLGKPLFDAELSMSDTIILYAVSFIALMAGGVLSVILIGSFERQFGALATLIVLGVFNSVFFMFFLTSFRRWSTAIREIPIRRSSLNLTETLTFLLVFAGYGIIAVAVAIMIMIAKRTNETVFWAMLAGLTLLSYISVKREGGARRR
jgi:hypothetical protein